MKKVTIKLKEPLRGPNNTEYTEVIIREPTVTEALRIGDPYVVGSAPSGAQLVVENFEAISEYTRICVVEPRDTALLDQGGVFLARELKRAVIDFFLLAGDEVAASETSPMTSFSAGSAAASTTSAG